jgi:hypothetical protein
VRKFFTNQVISASVIVLLLSFFVSSWMVSSTQDELEAYIVVAKQLKQDAVSASARADSAERLTDIYKARTDSAMRRVSTLNVRVQRLSGQVEYMEGIRDSLLETITDSIQLAREVIPLQDSIIKTQKTIIANQGTQIVNLNIALTNKDSTIVTLTKTKDDLQRIVDRIPPPPTNPNTLLGFKLPSRTTVGILSASAAAIATLLILK